MNLFNCGIIISNLLFGMTTNNLFSKNIFLEKLTDEFKIYISNNSDAYVYDYEIIHFYNDKGYFLKFKNDNENLESLLFKGNINNYKVLAIYNSNFIPIENNKNYCIDPTYFVDKTTFYNNLNIVSNDDFTELGVTYEKTIDSSRYLKINSIEEKVNENLTLDSSQYDINGVPNYINSLYNHEGCAPTSAAMYFAYLSNNGYENMTDNIIYPLKHNDNKILVEKLIKKIGDNYFNTKVHGVDSDMGGTNSEDIIKGYTKYYFDYGYDNYTCHQSKNFNELMNSIENCAIPVHTSIKVSRGHSLITYGYKRVTNGGSTSGFIMTNYADDSISTTVNFSVDYVRCFYFIYK